MSFHDEPALDLNDSDSAAGTLGPQYDLDACVALMRGGSKSFFAASKLLPPRVRSASIALYAFCRVADDVVDEGDDPAEGLRQLRLRLDCIYQGNPENHLEDHALALVVHQHKLPRPLLDGLLDGFGWDAEGTRYDSMEALHGYCARVAGTVGAMMAWIMGARASSTLARACELGVAMQLTNIARDVGEDARNGRMYLPLDWVRAEGLDPQLWLENPSDHPAIRRVVARMLEHADALYLQSTPGIADLTARLPLRHTGRPLDLCRNRPPTGSQWTQLCGPAHRGQLHPQDGPHRASPVASRVGQTVHHQPATVGRHPLSGGSLPARSGPQPRAPPRLPQPQRHRTDFVDDQFVRTPEHRTAAAKHGAADHALRAGLARSGRGAVNETRIQRHPL